MDKKEISEEQIQLYKDYLITFTSDHGKRVLEDLEGGYSNVNSFIQAKGDPYATVFNEGCRHVVLEIKRSMEIGENPEEYFKPQEEK